MNKFLIVLTVVVASTYSRDAMANIIGTVAQIAQSNTVDTPSLLNSIAQTLPAILSGLPAVAAVLAYVKGKVGDGVKIQFPEGALTLGSDALPSLITCQTPLVKNLACHICNLDCVYVHNTYGGGCYYDELNANQTGGPRGFDCVCQDNRNANGTLSTPVDSCGAFLGGQLDVILDAALIDFLYVRDSAALCLPLGNGTYDSSGCNSDCYSNHQYKTGVCKQAEQIPMTASQTGNGDTTTKSYCICSY